MAIVKCKPTSPGRRHVVKIVNQELYKGKPFAALLDSKSKSGGRNNNGRITTRHIGGGHKQHYRIVDFKRDKDGIPAKVERLEYDPNRTANIALVLYADGERRYILAPKGLKAGDAIASGADAAIKVGNALPMRNIPVGSTVHAVEMKPGKGAQLARSAGTFIQILAREGNYVTLRLRSGEVRKVLAECRATIGEVGNSEHMLRQLGKAGANRWRGIRPTVRGMAMNPVDHPHGGGEFGCPLVIAGLIQCRCLVHQNIFPHIFLLLFCQIHCTVKRLYRLVVFSKCHIRHAAAAVTLHEMLPFLLCGRKAGQCLLIIAAVYLFHSLIYIVSILPKQTASGHGKSCRCQNDRKSFLHKYTPHLCFFSSKNPLQYSI